MRDRAKSETISRRAALSLLGLAGAAALGGATTVLTASDAEAQTAGMDRRQDRRTDRRDRREDRRDDRQERRTERRSKKPTETTGEKPKQ
jgi:hypothetical protein